MWRILGLWIKIESKSEDNSPDERKERKNTYRGEFYVKTEAEIRVMPLQDSSVQFSHTVVSDSLWPHGLQHARLPVHHQLPEFTQTHVHRVRDAIQPSHPLSSPSPPSSNLSQHQGLFQWVSSLHQVAKVLEFQLQHQSFQWIFRTDFLEDWLFGSPCSPRDSQESSPSPGWMHETSALGRPRGIGWRGRWKGGSGWGTYVNPWLIHVNVWQKPLQYCKVISLQLIKINEEKKKRTAP